MNNKIDNQRRKFLQQLGIMAGTTTLLATQSKLQLIKSALAADYSNLTGHKSLVCVFLAGGNDAFNMFVPNGDNNSSSPYDYYSDIRQALAIPQGNLHPINDGSYGFHPSMAAVRDLYDSNRTALLANTGNLIQPLNRQQYLDSVAGDTSILIPQNLFSHNHQQEIWQTLRPLEAGTTPPGWGGLLADLLASANQGNNNLPPSFSLSGNNILQSGNSTQAFNVNSSGVANFSHFNGANWPTWVSGRTDAWNEILDLNQNHILEQQAANGLINGQHNINELIAALPPTSAIPNYNQYPTAENNIASNLRMVARLIAARENLGLKRQIFFIRADSWDTHSNQIPAHANLLNNLSGALAAFNQSLDDLGIADSVATFTASDFGRTSTSNGDGTDHGWGSHHLIMGGAVQGGQIYGSLPDIAPGSNDDSDGAGRAIPTVSVDQYGATLARWMGVTDNADLNAIFPNLHRFTTDDLGFMA